MKKKKKKAALYPLDKRPNLSTNSNSSGRKRKKIVSRIGSLDSRAAIDIHEVHHNKTSIEQQTERQQYHLHTPVIKAYQVHTQYLITTKKNIVFERIRNKKKAYARGCTAVSHTNTTQPQQ